MKRIFKSFFAFAIWGGAIPAAAGAAIMWLWNVLVVPACGFEPLNWLAAVGFFALGQLLTGGFILGIFLLGAISHGIWHGHHPHHRSHWHNLTPEQKKDFLEQRRRFFNNGFKTADSEK